MRWSFYNISVGRADLLYYPFSFELFDDASFYSCVLPQELDLNMLHLETW